MSRQALFASAPSIRFRTHEKEATGRLQLRGRHGETDLAEEKRTRLRGQVTPAAKRLPRAFQEVFYSIDKRLPPAILLESQGSPPQRFAPLRHVVIHPAARGTRRAALFMIHKKLNMITWNFILPVLLSGMSLAGDHLSKKEEMVETILMLPPSLFYEESRSAFQERIKEGKFWIDPEENRAYLLITGDGSFGERLFVLDSTSLYSIHCGNEEEGGGKEYAFYRYDRQHKEVSLIAAFKQSLFDNR